MSDRIEITDHLDVVRATVGDVHRRYAEHVEFDELLSEAAIWWYSDRAQEFLPEYLADANLTRLRRSIWRFIARCAEKEKAHARGYEPSDQIAYRPREILGLLPLAMDPAGLPATGYRDDGPAPKGNLAEGGDTLVALFDVRRALGALPGGDVRFLHLTEALAHDWDRIAAHTEVLPDSARRRHTRIAERMARWLNNEEAAA